MAEHFHPLGRQASATTVAAAEAVRRLLPFEDTRAGEAKPFDAGDTVALEGDATDETFIVVHGDDQRFADRGVSEPPTPQERRRRTAARHEGIRDHPEPLPSIEPQGARCDAGRCAGLAPRSG